MSRENPICIDSDTDSNDIYYVSDTDLEEEIFFAPTPTASPLVNYLDSVMPILMTDEDFFDRITARRAFQKKRDFYMAGSQAGSLR